MTKEEYIESIISQIDDKYAKLEVKNELEAHLDDRIDFYLNAGYDYEYALDKAISRMGDTETIGMQMNELHNNRRSNIFIWITTSIFCILAIAFLVSQRLPGELLDFFNLPGLIYDFAVIMFSASYLLSSKHRNHRALTLNAIVVFVISFIYQSVYVYFLDLGFLSPSIIDFCKTIINNYNSNVIQVFFDDNILIIIGILKVIILHISSAIALLYSAQINAQINGKAKTRVINRYRYFDSFPIVLLLSEIIPLAIIFSYFVK